MDRELQKLRKEIDKLDSDLITIFAKRKEVVEKIGQLKLQNNLPIKDPKRLSRVIEGQLKRAQDLKLSKSFIKKLYTLIHSYSLEIEKSDS